MVMTFDAAHSRISRELFDAEQAVDDALIKQSMLFTSIVTARRDLGLASTKGQDALLRLAKSQQSLLSAGGDLARVHGSVLTVSNEITGELVSDCPPGGSTKTGRLAAA
jgi:hypothetical protein